MRKIGWAAPILVTLAIFTCASARAQSKPPASGSTASALEPHWNHNGSIVSFVTDGPKQKIFYDTPRIGLMDAGVKPGTLLFEGRRNGQTWVGTAYQFYRTCKSRGYQVGGNTSDDLKQITLKGKAPLLDANCNVMGSRDDVLIFTANQSAPSKLPKDTPIASAPAASASAQTPNSASAANKPAAVSTAAPSAPPATNRTPDKPAAEPSSAKSSDVSAPNNAVSGTPAIAPGETAKDKHATINPGQQVSTVPPSEPIKDKQPAAPPQNTSNAAKSSATASSAAPSSEPVKDKQPSTIAGTESAPPKSDVSNTGNIPAHQNVAAPQSEPTKDTQVAAIPTAISSAAKTDDPSKTKNSAATGGAANDLRATIKSEVSIAHVDKTGTLIENKIVPTNPPEKMMEIVLKNGRVLRIGRDIDIEALLRIISSLER